MSHKHENLLNAIFHDPINSNIPWREVESLSGTRIHIKLNGHEGTLHRPHHGSTLGREDVKHVREFLAHSRVTPSLYAAANAPASPPTRQK
jgi:hypothetical protein